MQMRNPQHSPRQLVTMQTRAGSMSGCSQVDVKGRQAGLSVSASSTEFSSGGIGAGGRNATVRCFGLQFGQQLPHVGFSPLPIAIGLPQAERARDPDGGFRVKE